MLRVTQILDYSPVSQDIVESATSTGLVKKFPGLSSHTTMCTKGYASRHYPLIC